MKKLSLDARLGIGIILLADSRPAVFTERMVQLLESVAPRAAIVSCGFGNPFGFPSKESLAHLGDVGAEVFRTDLDGAVTVTTDGQLLRLESMSGRHLREAIRDVRR